VISEEDGEVVISARGDIDASTSPTLALVLSSLLAGKHPSIVLDLTDVGVVDADRAWVIAESSRLFGQRGGSLSVATANAAVREVLESADLGWLLVDEPRGRAD
jgi:anti-anti-sigma factor